MATNTFATSAVPDVLPASTEHHATAAPAGRFASPYLNGSRRISGWVRNASGVPQSRDIVLLVEPSMNPLARMRTLTADPQDTDYEFRNVADLTDTGERFVVVQRPEDFATAAQIRNGLQGV